MPAIAVGQTLDVLNDTAFASKPAPTQASSYIDRVPGLFFGAVHHHQQLRLHLAHRADPVGLLCIEVQRITAL